MPTVKDVSDDGRLIRLTEESAANTALTVVADPPAGQEWEFLYAAVHYSAVPVQGGVTATLNSAKGAAFDTLMAAGAANAQDTLIWPGGPTPIFPDDTLDVLAPAAGGAITSAVSVYMRKVG